MFPDAPSTPPLRLPDAAENISLHLLQCYNSIESCSYLSLPLADRAFPALGNLQQIPTKNLRVFPFSQPRPHLLSTTLPALLSISVPRRFSIAAARRPSALRKNIVGRQPRQRQLVRPCEKHTPMTAHRSESLAGPREVNRHVLKIRHFTPLQKHVIQRE